MRLVFHAHTQGQQYIKCLSRVGTISFHAASELKFQTADGNVDINIGGYQHINATDSVSIKVDADTITKKDELSMQSATHFHHTAKDILFESGGKTSLLTERSLNAKSNADILWQSEGGDLSISAPLGSTLINADGNISIEGTGNGDIILFNQSGIIKLDSSGNVELIGKDILTLNGQTIVFDGDVEYDIESPQTATEPSALQPPTIDPIAEFSLGGSSIDATLKTIELEYFYDDGEPVDDISFEVLDINGTVHTGMLESGLASIESLPVGLCEISYFGTCDSDEKELVALRDNFKQQLNNMLVEIKAKAAIGDALFEQESLFTQWAIETGAVMTGVYQGGKSIVTGIADIVVFAADVNIQVYSACFDIIDSLARGDIAAVKLQLETIIAYSEKSAQSLTQAFELLVVIIEDDETRNALSRFPYDYYDAHSYVEKHRIGGIFLFEILLAVLTAGVGSAVSAASKSKYVSKANKALVDIADILKRKRLNKQKSHALENGKTQVIDKIDKPKTELAVLEAPKFKRLPHPASIGAALNRLKAARQSIIKHGYRAKYTDDELLAMAQAGKMTNERFHVRIMDANYLEYKGKPGALGQAFEGTSGNGAKYWSTTFDQIEDADSDPKLISQKLGLDYDPESNLVMVVIDTQKATEIADTHTLIPTFDNLGAFTKTELPNNYTAAEVDKFMTPEFQTNYSKLYQEALDSDLMEAEWDTQGAIKYFNSTIDDPELVNLMKKRLMMQEKLGNNQHFLGNGLTKTLLPNNGQYGAVETFNFERKLVNLEEFGDAIHISDILKPIGN